MLNELEAALSSENCHHASENRYHDSEKIPDTENKQVDPSMEPAYKILIADDHPLFREAISSVIASGFEGSEIIETDDLDSALDITRENDDLDLILLHDDLAVERLSEVADGLWYPLWDANIPLDHSVRTVPQALQVAAEDTTAALGLLEARHIVGDEDLSSLLIGGVRQQWRTEIRHRFPEVVEHAQDRWRRAGDIAHRAEPDLKNGRGGLRDVQLLGALAIAQLTDGMGGLRPDSPNAGPQMAYHRLLDIRTELHRIAGRPREQVRAQDADEMGASLRIGDRFDLARVISDSARTISYSIDVGLRTAGNALPRRGLSKLRRSPIRRPLDEGVVDGIHLEGPWLAPGRCGAHDATTLRDPSPAEVDAVLEAGRGHLRMVTLAPERPGAFEAIRRFVDAGVVVALGHTDAGPDDVRAAIDAGADEVDMVINLGLLIAGDADAVQAEIAAVRRAAPSPTVLKVIIESAALDDDQIVLACRAAEAAGADFVKTSTGFHPAGGASVHAVELMADTVGGRLRVKASGGIRDYETACAMIEAGATRLGVSSTDAILAGAPREQ